MCLKVYLLCFTVWNVFISYSHGCEMNGINNWMLPEEVSILDVYRGIVFTATTTDIQGIDNVNFEGSLNSGPYLDISLQNAVFMISTNDAFALYEENETAEIISVTINFSCTGGSSRILVFEIGIEDTNNNDPEFKPNNVFEFTIVPPILPGYVITDCISDMMVRDIDLTTERIDFEIDENPYFTIEYDTSSSTTPKEFKAVVRTTNLIRSLSEPITLGISATDVDRTNDPPRTTYATMRIAADTQFQFPEEPLFSQPFYLADYTDDHRLVLTSFISLRQGYDNLVQFSLSSNEGYTDNFALSVNGNQVSINVILPLSLDMLPESQIYLVVNAEREFTSGASATVIVQLTEEVLDPVVISFAELSYAGQINNGALQIPQIVLLGDNYGDDLNLDITGVHASYFTYTRQFNSIEIQLLGELPPEVLENNSFLILNIQALYPGAISGYTTVVLEIIKLPEPQVIIPIFEQAHYTGEYSLQEGLTFVDVIQLSQGLDESVIFSLEGDESRWFDLVNIGDGRLSLTVIDDGIRYIMDRSHLVFTVFARKPESVYGRATVIISLTGNFTPDTNVFFDKNIYTGIVQSDQVQHEAITLTGYTDTVINILGEYSTLFVGYISDSSVYIQPSGSTTLPTEVSYIVLELQAGDVSTVLILDIIHADSTPETSVLFDKNVYTGIIQSNQVQHEDIFLTGYTGTVINILGEYSGSFVGYISDTSVYIQTSGTLTLPADVSYIVLELQAGDVSTVLILDVIHDGESTPETSVFFDKNFYTGIVQSNQVSHEAITLTGYSGTDINILGEYSTLFVGYISDTSVYVQASGSVTLPTDVPYIVLELQAGDVSSLLILDVINAGDLTPDTSVFFDKNVYTGIVQSNQVQHEVITLTGFTGTVINILGEYSTYFVGYISDTSVYIQASGLVILPTDVSYIVLELQAGDVRSALILDVIHDGDSTPETSVFFDKNIYTGIIQSEQVQHEAITVTGYTGSVINILGEYSTLFVGYISDTSVYIYASGLVILPADVSYIVLELQAGDVSSVLILDVIYDEDSTPEIVVFFDKNIYTGIVQSDQVQHETITLTGYTGTDINILGEYSTLFVGYISDTSVNIQALGSITLPSDLSYIVLELRAGDVSCVLILDVISTNTPILPSVTFSSASYILRADITQTGLVGQVLATADNGEMINYSLIVDNAQLEGRLAVNNEGELRLSAPANSGVYVFQVLATTAITRVTATAQVQLTVDVITNCGAEDNIVVPPLIVIDRDEETPHQNLVVLDRTAYEGCSYTLINHWPIDQTWLYVDENGLHTAAIDREHESIAFMALSQVQVELVLHCESDAAKRRKKRSFDMSPQLDWLGPYNYGSKQWLLADTILYNSRRSLVNLIVNDINDNAPVFVGKENEPITVGYPIYELEETVLPRALAQLRAMDADIGENAALMYWSDEPILAVSPTTGFVHVRDIGALQDNALLTVNATDRNGAGLTGSILLMVRLLDINHIAVVTIRDAFLENEEFILANLSNAVGYSVNVLRSVVISVDAEEEDSTRTKREEVSSPGASLQLYVYGLIEGVVPVAAEILSSDINDAVTVFTIENTLSLEDFLENSYTSETQGSNIGLMVATIVLSMLLFILVVANFVWYYLKRTAENHREFSDENSLVSQTDSLGQQLKNDVLTKPKLDIEELKKSERRLQDMLDAPIDNVTIEPKAISTPVEAVLNMSPPELNVPIVIQSIDKLKDASDDSEDDEFGEIKRRKSVVTFNENVEKIIHVEDDLDRESPDLEVYKL